jgi:hypothetical protein
MTYKMTRFSLSLRVDRKPIEIAVQLNTILALFKPVTTPNFLPISDRFLIDTKLGTPGCWKLDIPVNLPLFSIFVFFVCLIVKVKRSVQHNFLMYNDDGIVFL